MDSTDKEILRIIQADCKLSAKQIAKKVGSLTTTVYAKIKRMEDLGLIKGYHAQLDAKNLGKPVTAFVHVSFEYHGAQKPLSQREVAKKIAKFSEVQEIHLVSGDWDIVLKIKCGDVDAVGKFVVDKLRKVGGIGKVETSMVFGTEKEGLGIEI